MRLDGGSLSAVQFAIMECIEVEFDFFAFVVFSLHIVHLDAGVMSVRSKYGSSSSRNFILP